MTIFEPANNKHLLNIDLCGRFLNDIVSVRYFEVFLQHFTQSSTWLCCRLDDQRTGFRLPTGAENFIFTMPSRRAVGLIQLLL
jgi:hypothetical protein